MAVGDADVFPGFLTPVLTQLFLSKATDYFSHMLLQRWEAKIRRKEKSPQPGIELTTTRSWVRHAHHWATRAGLTNGMPTRQCPWYIFLEIQRILLEKKWYNTHIFRTWMHFLRFMTQSTSSMTSLEQLVHFDILPNSCLSMLQKIKLIKSDVQR